MYDGTLNLSASSISADTKVLEKETSVLSSIISGLDKFSNLKKGIDAVISKNPVAISDCEYVADAYEAILSALRQKAADFF